MPDLQMSIRPSEIREIRKRLGLTQTEFAERLQVTRDCIAHWELGRHRPGGPAEILLRQLATFADMTFPPITETQPTPPQQLT